jgi:ribosome-binding protein aMBF1 (putative translation factor)
MQQDWKQVIFKKSPEPKKNIPQRDPIKKLEDDEVILPYLNADMRKMMIQARVNKKLSQVQLAHQCNLQLHTIQCLESGKPIPLSHSAPALNTVKKCLNVLSLKYSKS